MIRRELPLTNVANPARPVAYFRRGFSFVLAPAAADLVLEMDCLVQRFWFFPIWKVFDFVFSCHAAMGCRRARSTLIAMAQMKPSSSRATAVVTFL